MKVKSNEEIRLFLMPIAKEVGVEIFDVEFKKGKNPSLTVYIDKKDGGVDLDTCEKFHNAIFEPLDELNPTFDMPYTLNVSSVGADRPFKTEEDFTSRIGKRVEVKLKSSVMGKKFFDGILKTYSGTEITLEVDKKTTLTINLKDTVKVNDYIDF